MLQAIRDRISGVMAIIVLGLLAIPFAFFGVGNYFQPDLDNNVAMVGDMEIPQREFQTSFNSYRNQMRQMLGDSFDEMQYTTPLARREHLQDLIDQRLLQQYGVANGMDIPQDRLVERIREIEAFQVAGTFSPEIYNQALAFQGMTPAEFEAGLREDMVTRNLVTALSATGQPPPAEINSLVMLEKQTRSIDYVFVDAAPYRDSMEITAEQIAGYYDEHQQQFMQPEQVSIEYLDLNPQQSLADIEPDENELRDLYASQKQRFVTEERRRAQHILLTSSDEQSEADAEAMIKSLRERIIEGENFAKLAREYSQDPGSAEQGGDLGWVEPGVMVSAFEDALYALEAGEVSAPVKTGFGWHLIKLNEIDPSEGKTFAEAREELEQEWIEDAMDRQYRNIADEMVNLSFEHPDTLQPIADALSLEVQKSELFSRENGTGIAANAEVRDAAFSDLLLLERSNSDPIELSDQRMVIARIDEHIEATPRPLDDVRDEIRLLLQRELASARAREVAEQIATAAVADDVTEVKPLRRVLRELTGLPGADDTDSESETDNGEVSGEAAGNEDALAAASKDTLGQSLQVVSKPDLTRSDYQLGQVFLQGVFSMNPGADDRPAVMALPRNGQDWAVVALHDISAPADKAANEQMRNRFRTQLQRQLANQELEALLAQLRANTEIKIFEDRL
mgnify:CR=1 FL=1